MHSIFRSGHCMWHFCVDKICELQIIGSRVIYLFFGRVTSPEYASVAQMAEQRIRNAQVGSSSLPSSSTVRLGDALFENPPKKLSAGACTC